MLLVFRLGAPQARIAIFSATAYSKTVAVVLSADSHPQPTLFSSLHISRKPLRSACIVFAAIHATFLHHNMTSEPTRIEQPRQSLPPSPHTPIPDTLYKTRYSFAAPQESICAVKISPDKKTLATSSSSGAIRVYDLASGTPLIELRGHTKGVSSIDYSPINPDVLVSGSDDLTVRLWSIASGKCLKVLRKHTYHVTTVKFIGRGSILLSGSADETVTVWDLTSGKTLRTLSAHSDPILALAVTPDDTIIVSGSFDGLMRLFDLETGYCLKTLVYNSASQGTATASTADVVNFPISHVNLSPNGKFILSSSLDGAMRLWDYMDNKVIKTYLGVGDLPNISTKYICETAFITAGDSLLIVSGSESSGLLFWDVQTKEIVCQIKVSDGAVLGVDTTDGGRVLACCTNDGVVTVLDMV